MTQHQEATTFLQVILTKEGPLRTTVDCLLARAVEDSFSVRVFRNWMKVAEAKLTGILGTMLQESKSNEKEDESKLTIKILTIFSKLGLQYKDSSKCIRHVLDLLSEISSSELRKTHPTLLPDTSDENTKGQFVSVNVKQEKKFELESGVNVTKIGIKKQSKLSLSKDIKEKKRKREAWII